MNYSLIKKSLIIAILLSLFISMLLIHPNEEYLKEIGALIKLKGFGEENQHSLDLQKMRPSFQPSPNP